MCIAIPVTILAVDGGLADVAAKGGRLRVDARLIPEAKTGDRALVHAGCAISLISGDEADGLEALFEELDL